MQQAASENQRCPPFSHRRRFDAAKENHTEKKSSGGDRRAQKRQPTSGDCPRPGRFSFGGRGAWRAACGHAECVAAGQGVTVLG